MTPVEGFTGMSAWGLGGRGLHPQGPRAVPKAPGLYIQPCSLACAHSGLRQNTCTTPLHTKDTPRPPQPNPALQSCTPTLHLESLSHPKHTPHAFHKVMPSSLTLQTQAAPDPAPDPCNPPLHPKPCCSLYACCHGNGQAVLLIAACSCCSRI